MPSDLNFVLVDKKNESFFWKLRKGSQGGLSIVINRKMVAGETTIREGPNGRLCKRICSLDCNALYLGCLTKQMPLHHFCTYRAPYYKREKSFEYGILAYEWLSWYAYEHKVEIRHKFNNLSEFRVLGIPVDGYIKESKTIMQFQGCYHHGCQDTKCKMPYKFNRDGSKKTHNPTNNKPFEQLYKETAEKIEMFKDQGYKVIEMWEHTWRKLRLEPEKRVKINDLFYNDKYHPPNLNQDKLIHMIQNEEIFGFAEVDMHCPDDRKDEFKDFQPFYKNVEVDIDNIGDHMKQFAEDNGLMKRPVKCLLLSYFTKKSMLLTPFIKWYLDHGMVIDRIHTFYSFKPDIGFTQFVDKIVTNRRKGDVNPDQKILSELSKLLGNSSIGKALLQKEKHKNIHLADDKKASFLINNARYDEMNELDNEVYEVAMRKRSIRHNVPLTLGCVVYSYSKLEMLKFVYDFLYKYFDKEDVGILNSDTDSIWLGMSATSLDDLVKPHLREEYFSNYHKVMPAVSCDEHRDLFVEIHLKRLSTKPNQETEKLYCNINPK